jgi:hypothetical protein
MNIENCRWSDALVYFGISASLPLKANKVYFQCTALFQETWRAKATHNLKELPADTLPAHLPSEH